MKKLIIASGMLTTFSLIGQNIPNIFTVQQQQGTYRVEAKHNNQATQEQKDAFNAELHKLGGEVSEKIKHLILTHKAILDMQGTHPIITLICQWNNVEITIGPVKTEDHSSTPLPSSNAS